MRRLASLILVVAMAATLSACGRKGRLIAPEGSTYPRQYPDIQFPQAPAEPGARREGAETQTP